MSHPSGTLAGTARPKRRATPARFGRYLIRRGSTNELYSEYVQGDGVTTRRPAGPDRRRGEAAFHQPQRPAGGGRPAGAGAARRGHGLRGDPAVPGALPRRRVLRLRRPAAGRPGGSAVTPVLVDTSVALKWFHEEGEAEVAEARAVLAAHQATRITAYLL